MTFVLKLKETSSRGRARVGGVSAVPRCAGGENGSGFFAFSFDECSENPTKSFFFKFYQTIRRPKKITPETHKISFVRQIQWAFDLPTWDVFKTFFIIEKYRFIVKITRELIDA